METNPYDAAFAPVTPSVTSTIPVSTKESTTASNPYDAAFGSPKTQDKVLNTDSVVPVDTSGLFAKSKSVFKNNIPLNENIKISQAPAKSWWDSLTDKVSNIFEPITSAVTEMTPRERANVDLTRKTGTPTAEADAVTSIKIPFMNSVAMVKKFPVLTDTIGWLIETPERIVNDIHDTFAGVPDQKPGQATVDSYLKQAQSFYSNSVENGADPTIAKYASVLYGMGQGLFDVTFIGGLLEKGAKGLLAGEEKNLAQQGALETLGQPKDMKEATLNRNKLAFENHPDKGGDTVKMAKINNAYATLEKYGIPKSASPFKQTLQDVAKKYLDAIGSKYPAISKAVNESENFKKSLLIDNNGDIHPTVAKETKAAIESHGVDITHGALQEKLGATPEQATTIINKIHADRTPAEIKKSIQQVAAKVLPVAEKPSEVIKQTPAKVPELISNHLKQTYGTDISKATRTQLTDTLKQFKDQNIPYTDNIFKKITTPKSGFDVKIPGERGDNFIYGGKHLGVYTDSYTMILDSNKADKLREENIASRKKKDVAKLVKKGMNFAEAEKLTTEEIERLKKQAQKNYPTKEAINQIMPARPGEKAWPQVIHSSDWGPAVTLSNGKEQETVNANRLALLKKMFPEATIHLNGGNKPISFVEKGKTVAIMMPLKSDEFPVGVDYKPGGGKVSPSKEANNHESGKINSTLLTGGLDKFIQQDIVPGAKEGGKNVMKTWDILKKSINPTSRGLEAKTTASITREALARMAREKEMLYEKLKEAQKLFDKNSNEANLKFIDDVERGVDEGKFSNIIRQALDERWKKIQGIKNIDTYIENYFPHMWKDTEKASEKLGNFYGKRPLEGTKGYLKQRTIPYTKDGIDLGLEPISYNPVELVMARIADMDRFIMANNIWTQFKEQGLRKFVGMGDKAPDGWIQVNDKISKSFQFSESEKGLVYRGNWYMPEQAATILNNYLSPGLRGNPVYDSFRMLANTMNQANLGLSAFHATFTSVDAVISKTALELQKVFSKSLSLPERISAAAKFATSPIGAPIHLWNNLVRGNKLLIDYYKQNPQIPQLVDAMMKAGGRATQDSFYKNNSMRNFLKVLKSGNLPGAVLRAPFTAIEVAAAPIMDYLVPRQKLGIFADQAQFILKESETLGLSEMETTARLQEAWDSVDNRMGQMVYDNLFWNKTLKDSAMLSTRSLGWNLGTIRELGGGAVDFAKQGFKGATGKGARMTPKMAYTISLPFVSAVFGAIIYYLYNGTGPEEPLDYFYPKTGKLKPDGTPERVSIPTYMKDVFAYYKEPMTTVTNKVNPIWGTIIDMLENKDYYGTEIRNINDPVVRQVQDEFMFLIKQFEPYSISGALKRKESGEGLLQQAESFFGLMPAPGYITKTATQTEITKLYNMRFGGKISTQDQSDAAQMKSKIRNAYLQGDANTANALLEEAVKKGYIKSAGVTTFIKDTDIPSDIRMFKGLPAEDQMGLLKNMSLKDLERYAWYSDKMQLPNTKEVKKFIEGVQSSKIKQPIWKQQKNIAK